MLPKEKVIYDLLFSLPVAARLDMLVLSIIQRESGGSSPNAVNSLSALIALTTHMAAALGPEARFKLSTKMRDAADVLERPAVCVG